MQNVKLYALAGGRPAPGISLLVLAVLLLAIALPAAAAPVLVAVDAVQWPVWIERNGERRPLVAGEAIGNRDRLTTGSGGRVLLRLADGSGVKLGENAQIAINGLGRRPGGVMTAALDVAAGAFRFTTGLFSEAFRQRAVNIRIATITAGIRGTDIWGKSDDARDLVCLIEGRISVTHPLAAEAQTMDQPLTFYVAAKGQAPGAVSSIDAAQLAKWAADTELEAGKGVGRAGGRWRVGLGVVESEAEALALLDRVRAAGYPATARPRKVDSGYRYDVRVAGLASAVEAEAVAARLRAALGLTDVRVGR